MNYDISGKRQYKAKLNAEYILSTWRRNIINKKEELYKLASYSWRLNHKKDDLNIFSKIYGYNLKEVELLSRTEAIITFNLIFNQRERKRNGFYSLKLISEISPSTCYVEAPFLFRPETLSKL